MKNRTCRVSVPSVFASLFMLLALAVAFPRVDISDGTTGQLFVSWDQVSTATYYELQRSTSPSSGYADVANCSVAADAKNLDTPWVSKVCRDNNGGNPNPLLLAGTPYYYRVRACNSTPCTGTYTTTAPSNTPVTCNCSQGSTSSQIPPMRGLHPPATIPGRLLTKLPLTLLRASRIAISWQSFFQVPTRRAIVDPYYTLRRIWVLM